jgi:hypothetical protein
MVRLALLLCSGCQLVFPRSDEAGIESDGPNPLPAACGDPRLLACYDFEGNTLDGSPQANDLVSPAGMGPAFVPGIDGTGALFTFQTRTAIADPHFTATALSIDTWINYTPSPEAQIVIDHNTRWALAIDATGAVTCGVASGANLATPTRLSPGVWTHVACTQTGSENATAMVQIFINGISDAKMDLEFFGMIPDNPAGVGANYPGATDAFLASAIDRLRVWDATLSSDEILTAAGLR